MPGDERAERAGRNLTQHDHRGNDQNRARVLHQERRIDEQTDGDKENRAEHIAQRFHEGLDARDLPRFGDDGADEKRSERDTVFEFHGEQRNAKAKPEDGDEQHFIALESRDIIEESRHDNQAGHEQDAEE